MKNRRWAGKRSGIAFGAVALILTALVVPYACAGTTGAVPFSGDNPSSGTRTVTIADITDFHGHIERGADNATAFTVADSHNPGNMIPVSTGDLVGGSPYEFGGGEGPTHAGYGQSVGIDDFGDRQP